jgi:hypothetical protein
MAFAMLLIAMGADIGFEFDRFGRHLSGPNTPSQKNEHANEQENKNQI